MSAVLSFCGLSLLVIVGKLLRVRVAFFQKLYLPASVIGGLLGLVVLQLGGERIPEAWTAGWARLPGILINVVFGALFLGLAIPSLGTIWRRAGPQLVYGKVVAWGQYVVGLGLVLLLLGPLFGVSALFGVIVPVGFEGGHGTASGLAETFAQLGWPEGTDYGLTSATVGIITAIIVGMALINWAARRGHLAHLRRLDDLPPEERAGLYAPDRRPAAGRQTVVPDSIDSLALHLAIIGIAILLGVAIKQGFVAIEDGFFDLATPGVLSAFPLFPLCMIGGLLVQIAIGRTARISPIDRGLMQRISGTALDFLVVAAISTIRLEVIAQGIVPFATIMLAGVLWNLFCVLWVARRLLPDFWFERAIAELGQSMGVTATGLLLLRVVDPESETEAPPAFGYKQLIHEPFMGGGLWTSGVVLLVATKGGLLGWLISVGALAAWLLVWWIFLRRQVRRSQQAQR